MVKKFSLCPLACEPGKKAASCVIIHKRLFVFL